MKKEQNVKKITDLMALVVFAVFAVCVLLVLLTGAKVYRELTDRGAGDHDRRVTAQYVATRVRQADRAGSVSVEEFGGLSALVLREEIGGEGYLTRVYCFEGYLRELFTAEGGNFAPEDGEKLLAAEDIAFSLNGGLLSACITLSDGSTQELMLFLRSGEGAAP